MTHALLIPCIRQGKCQWSQWSNNSLRKRSKPTIWRINYKPRCMSLTHLRHLSHPTVFYFTLHNDLNCIYMSTCLYVAIFSLFAAKIALKCLSLLLLHCNLTSPRMHNVVVDQKPQLATAMVPSFCSVIVFKVLLTTGESYLSTDSQKDWCWINSIFAG